MVKAIVIKIIRVTFWTSQYIFPHTICSHRGLNIGRHHCVQNVQNVQLEKIVEFTQFEKFIHHHWSHCTGAANDQLWSNLGEWMEVQGEIKQF